MKLFSTILDVALLPVAAARDVLDISNAIDGKKSFTRQQVKKIDQDLED